MAQVLSKAQVEDPVTMGPPAHDLRFAAAASSTVILIMSGAYVAGAIRPAIFYPATDRYSLPTDVFQLVGVPILLSSVLMARRNIIWLLLWPGTLFYLLYHDLAYVFAMRPNVAFVLHVVLAGLNVYAAVALASAIDAEAVRRTLAGAVYERLWRGSAGCVRYPRLDFSPGRNHHSPRSTGVDARPGRSHHRFPNKPCLDYRRSAPVAM
jgi:hypothetical protein